MDCKFELKKCNIGLFNPKIEEYFYSIEMIKDAAKLIEKKQTTLAHQYLDFVYDMANTYLFPCEESKLDEAVLKTREFIAKYKNSNSQH
jgi:hypothetical protein